MGEVVILDIGHGNSAVLSDDCGVVIIDAGVGDTLLEFLHQKGIKDIDEILISHGDSDHISGVISLLSQKDILIHSIRLNADSARKTAVWHAFRIALVDARKRSETSVHAELTTSPTNTIDRGEIRIEVLAPTPEIALSGVGGQDLQGRELGANSLSAVIRVVYKDTPQVLFAGDVDGVGLDNLLEEHPEPRARVLIFPHHGGRPGRDDAFEFAHRLCRAVLPEIVVFSIGRGKHGTPLPEIVRGVRHAVPMAHVACTQLSERCAATLPARQPRHLSERAARGRLSNSCCCGTLEMVLGESDIARTPSLIEHRQFVMREAPTALCMEPRTEAGDQQDSSIAPF